MNAQNPHILHNRRPIRQLDDAAANRIAAGEVVERPASAVKELVENALDAEARRVEIAYSDGGKTLLRVVDDGTGIPEAELALALSRHATSKIDGSDLLNIHSFGFRGEALPSLGSVGRLSITSRFAGTPGGFQMVVDGGKPGEVTPAAGPQGTTVELRGLFRATPARLKFLRSTVAEARAIGDVVKRLAMAAPNVAFVLRDISGGKERITFRADVEGPDGQLQARLRRIMGREFIDNALEIEAERQGMHLSGYAALPTYSRGAAVAQFFFVNGRPVRDKQLHGALRAAYSDFLSRDRHPAAVLFIDCDPEMVDVNVHPAKAEVRFREPGIARGLIVSALRHALAGAGHRASSTVGTATLGAMQPEAPRPDMLYQMPLNRARGFAPATGFAESDGWQAGRVEAPPQSQVPHDLPLGVARAQLHENYIVAQTKTGMVIVDQHAAHERLVYERLKRQSGARGVPSQALLIPEIVELPTEDRARLLEAAAQMATLGLVYEPFGEATLCVRETPAILGEINAASLMRDLADELADLGQSQTVQDRIEAVLSRMSCHGSIRSGRMMSAPEMDALLREMEATPHSGQCNHGRPTYVELKLADIERLFGRT